MDLNLDGKAVLITGGSRGIGAATARLMAKEGARLILVARNAENLDRVARELREAHGDIVRTAVCNVADAGQIAALAEAFPDVDILVNNAGDMPSGSILDISDARWRAGWDSKVSASIRMCRTYYPLMRTSGHGVIVNISGIGADLCRWDYICSGMGNNAIEFLTRTLGAHSPRDNIRVVCVSPGAVATDRQERVMADWFGATAAQPKWPFDRRAMVEELAQTIAFLASDRSSYTSGTVHVVDGGAAISRPV